jgi:hypothetical protein
MDPESVDILRRMCGVAVDAAAPAAAPGSKVRLHIDGLASPMRARVKGAERAEVTVGSDLGFLQVGKQLDLEDAESGTKRAARIDRVDVAVDPSSHVPQLVVTLRYADAPEGAEERRPSDSKAEIPIEEEVPVVRARASSSVDASTEEARDMKGAVARGMSAIGPAFAKIATRAKTTVALLAAKRAAERDADAPRRTTAPAPGGGLHTSGRRVVRGGEAVEASDDAPPEPKMKITKRKVAIAGAAVVALTLGVMAMRKPHAQAADATAAGTSTAASTIAASAPNGSSLLTANHLPPMATNAVGMTPAMSSPSGLPPLPAIPGAPPAPMAMGAMPDSESAAPPSAPDAKNKKHGKVTPFGNPVAHGNILHLKMDGAIDQIQGAAQPTGFTVKIPGRKSLEAAGPLAARDARIAAVKVTNDPAGAELTFTFKDGVPKYQVRAKGDTLEIALAPVGKAGDKDKAVAAKKSGTKHGATAKKKDKAPDKH